MTDGNRLETEEILAAGGIDVTSARNETTGTIEIEEIGEVETGRMTLGIETERIVEKEITEIQEVERDCLRIIGKKTEIDTENRDILTMKTKSK